MAGRLRRRAAVAEAATTEEGPFVSFTDLFIGILFLFLILVAALMLMHQEAVRLAKLEEERLSRQIMALRIELERRAKLDVDHPPFRLALVYNSYQKPAGEEEWTFSRTVQVFRTPNGLCLTNILLRNNLSTAWKPPLKAEAIPKPSNQDFVRQAAPCALTAAGEQWNTDAETGGVRRVGPMLYSGRTVLHKKDDDEAIDIQYRVLGIFDDYYGAPTASGGARAMAGRRG